MSNETAKPVAPGNVVDLQSVKKMAQKTVKKAAKCPICAKPADPEFRPFCCKRCADVDLGKWLGEGYRIPTDDVAGYEDGLDGED